jgi:hypothetical protein
MIIIHEEVEHTFHAFDVVMDRTREMISRAVEHSDAAKIEQSRSDRP